MIDALRRLVGDGDCYEPTDDDLIEPELGIRPRCVIKPSDESQLAAVLRCCQDRKLAVVPWGGGQHQRYGLPPRADVVLLTTGLTGVVEHDVADQTITVRAGTRLADVLDAAARAEQWLPLDPPGRARATLGGVIAAGLNGGLRTGYGLGKDYLLGSRAAHADGVVARSGGRLVKNVTGFDLHRLYHGSMGTLAVVTEISLRLLPAPRRDETWVLPFDDVVDLDAYVAGLLTTKVRPAAFTVIDGATASRIGCPPRADGTTGSVVAVLRLAGDDATVERFARDALSIVVRRDRLPDPLTGALADALLGRLREEAFSLADDSAVVSISYLPMDGDRSMLGATLEAAASIVAGADQPVVLVAEPLLGLLRVGVDASLPDEAWTALARLGADRDPAPLVVIERGPPSLRRAWAGRLSTPVAASLQRRVQRALDPVGILSPGRLLPEDRS